MTLSDDEQGVYSHLFSKAITILRRWLDPKTMKNEGFKPQKKVLDSHGIEKETASSRFSSLFRVIRVPVQL